MTVCFKKNLEKELVFICSRSLYNNNNNNNNNNTGLLITSLQSSSTIKTIFTF